GVAFLFVWPIPLTVLSLIVFGVLPMALWGKDESMLALAPITLGFIVVFAFALGYVMAALGNVLVASARGEIHHPRWPDIDFGEILGSLARWGLAIGFGMLFTAWPARMYWNQHPLPTWGNRLAVGQIIALGGPVTLVA